MVARARKSDETFGQYRSALTAEQNQLKYTSSGTKVYSHEVGKKGIPATKGYGTQYKTSKQKRAEKRAA